MTARKQITSDSGEIGERIRALRQALGLTQEQLATRLGVSFPTVNRWENNHAKPSPLAMEKIEALAKRLIKHKGE